MKLEILQKLIALANNNPNENEANLAARKVCKALIEHKFNITGGTTSTNTPPKPPPSSRPNPATSYGWDYVDFDDIFGRGRSSKYSGGSWSGQYSEQDRRDAERRKNEERQREQERQKEAERRRQENERRRQEQQNRGRGGYSQNEWKILSEREATWKYEYYNQQVSGYTNPIMGRTFTNTFQEHWYTMHGRRHHTDNPRENAQRNYGKPPEQDEPKVGYEYNRARDSQTNNPNDDKYYSRRRERGFGFESRTLTCKTCKRKINTKFVGAEHMFECNECAWDFAKNSKGQKEAKRCCDNCKTPISCIGSGYCSLRNKTI